jgi:N-formylmaleamate deformylase
MPNYNSEDIHLANGLTIHYYRSGGKLPPLVLAHGITDDGLCWLPIADALTDICDVIMVDARGHGLTSAPSDGYTLRNLAEDMALFCQALHLDKPILLGHSMGAITTLLTAGLYPDLPHAILLEDPPPFWQIHEPILTSERAVSGLAEWIASNKRKTRADLLAELRENSAHWPAAEWEPWIDSKHRYDPKVGMLVQPPDLVSIDFAHTLARITCPALVITADPLHGSASGPADIEALQQLIPQLRVEPVAGAGHNIRRDQPARYVEIIRAAI